MTTGDIFHNWKHLEVPGSAGLPHASLTPKNHRNPRLSAILRGDDGRIMLSFLTRGGTAAVLVPARLSTALRLLTFQIRGIMRQGREHRWRSGAPTGMEDNMERKVINIAELRAQSGDLSGLVSPAVDVVEEELAVERAVDPIKDPADIHLMMDYYRSNCQWRNLLYFTIALHTGLRVSDMLRLRWGSLIGEDLRWRDEIVILEKKTARTRKRARNRHIAISQGIKDICSEYLGYMDARGVEITLDLYLFRAESNNATGENRPMHRNNVERFLKKAATETGVAERVRVATHTLRKTFGYHYMRRSGNSERALLLLQKMFGHSSVRTTLLYIGLTDEEIRDAYLGLWDNTDTFPSLAASS